MGSIGVGVEVRGKRDSVGSVWLGVLMDYIQSPRVYNRPLTHVHRTTTTKQPTRLASPMLGACAAAPFFSLPLSFFPPAPPAAASGAAPLAVGVGTWGGW